MPDTRIGLVGCVATKLDRRAPARDLYTSPLFVGRRRWVEATCDRWYILSAAHYLVHPDTELDPYDATLGAVPRYVRESWARQVLIDLIGVEGPDWSGTIFEVHAGLHYVQHGLEVGLAQRGGRVVRPAEGLGQGQQLALYRHGPPTRRRPPAPAGPDQ
jgi:hypothetical protein